MEYMEIPGTGLRPSAIGLGAVKFGSIVPEDRACRLLDAYRSLGGNLLDAQRAPGSSPCEEVLGRWLRRTGNRSGILLGSKSAVERTGRSRLAKEKLEADLDESLRALGTDYLDIFWLQKDDGTVPAADIVGWMEALVRRGKIRCYGFSNWAPGRVREALASGGGRGAVAGSQLIWSLARPNREAFHDGALQFMDEETMALHREANLAVFAGGSQAGGFFRNYPYFSVIPMDDGTLHRYYSDDNIARYRRVAALSEELAMPVTEIVLAYLTSQPVPTVPLIGPEELFQLEASMKAGDRKLDREAIRYLETGE